MLTWLLFFFRKLGGSGTATANHYCGDVNLLPTYNARVAAMSKYNAQINLLPTYNALVEAKEC